MTIRSWLFQTKATSATSADAAKAIPSRLIGVLRRARQSWLGSHLASPRPQVSYLKLPSSFGEIRQKPSYAVERSNVASKDGCPRYAAGCCQPGFGKRLGAIPKTPCELVDGIIAGVMHVADFCCYVPDNCGDLPHNFPWLAVGHALAGWQPDQGGFERGEGGCGDAKSNPQSERPLPALSRRPRGCRNYVDSGPGDWRRAVGESPIR